MHRPDPIRMTERQARAEYKGVLVKIRDFVLYGHGLDTLAIQLLTGQEPTAASQALRVEGCVDELQSFVGDHVPTGHFPDLKAIERWQAHQGLSAAPPEDRMFFWMKSTWWSPKQVGRVHAATPVHA